MVVDGASMEPTYAAHGFNVCVLTAYRSHPPARGDVVTLKYGGTRYMLLKRVLAFEGETVAFSNGVCLVNGKANRSVPFEEHVGGEISLARVAGRTLW